MRGLGVREWVALAVLGVALMFGAIYFGPLSNDGRGGDGPSPVELAPTETPTVAPTATPVPPTALAQPVGGWILRWYEVSSTGSEIKVAEGPARTIELDAPGRPFPDMRDDVWRREATRSLNLEAGEYTFTLETDGAVKVVLGERVLLDVEDGPARNRHVVTFEHDGRASSMLVEVRDVGGPVWFRWE